jgi:hypothetical protein
MNLPDGPWLNVGSGPVAPQGWTCIDGSWQSRLAGSAFARVAAALTGRDVGHWPSGIVCRDVRHGLGFAPGSVAVIYSSHFIEHLYRDEALAFLRDAHQTLKRGGVIRIVTPDLAAIVERYARARALGNGHQAASQLQAALHLRPPDADRASGVLGWYRRRTSFDAHKFVYDGPALRALLIEAGFGQPVLRGYLESDLATERLALVEESSRIVDGAGICVEARR